MQRTVLEPLLKMLSSTFICQKLKLPVMNLLENEASDQTGSRSMRTRSLCASRNFPKKLAFASLSILNVFTFVLYKLNQCNLLYSVVSAIQQYIQTDLTDSSGSK